MMREEIIARLIKEIRAERKKKLRQRQKDIDSVAGRRKAIKRTIERKMR